MSLFRSSFLGGLLVAALHFVMTGCGAGAGPEPSEAEFEMGSAVTVGSLTYTIIDQRWQDSLNGPDGARLPKHRFLSLSLSVSNGANEEAGIPLLTLVGSDGKEYQEEARGDGLTDWLGFIRLIGPVQTDHGRILFDVPPGAYKLRVSSGGEPENEKTALVNIPFRVEAPTSVGEETLMPQGR